MHSLSFLLSISTILLYSFYICSCQACTSGRFSDSFGRSTCTYCPAGKFHVETEQTKSELCTDCKHYGARPISSPPLFCFPPLCFLFSHLLLSYCFSGVSLVWGFFYFHPSLLFSLSSSSFSSSSLTPLQMLNSFAGAAGKYSSLSRTSCPSCAAGKYNDVEGLSICRDCAAGYYSQTNHKSCLPCSAGKYSVRGKAVRSEKSVVGKATFFQSLPL